VEKTKGHKRIIVGTLLLALVVLSWVLIQSGREVVTRLDEYQVARTEYSELREQLTIPFPAGAPNNESNEIDEAEAEGIDFDALREINPNVVGWLVVPGTDISYPIVQGTDNSWYLHHTFRNERNGSGAIFLDYRNRADFTDWHNLVHGHNMRDGSMFAPLHGWSGDAFIIHAPDGTWTFEVFNRQTVGATDEVYQLRDVDGEGQIVTLSTCVTGRVHLRYIVQGRASES